MLIAIEPKNYVQYVPAKNTNSVYNFNANISGIRKLNLMPRIANGDIAFLSTQEFDDWYIKSIIQNDNNFYAMMQVMVDLRDGKDVFILFFNEEDIFIPILESFLKVIQVRYGYNYQIADPNVDWYQTSGFSTEGILAFDADYERYLTIKQKMHPYTTNNKIIGETHV